MMTTSTWMDHRFGNVRLSLGFAVACAVPAMDPAAAAGFATVARPARLANGGAVVGAAPGNRPIHVEVALRLRDREGLDALIAANAGKQARGQAQRLLAREEMLANHAPTPAQARAVADYLGERGFRHIVIAPNRLLVSADGTVATARAAFMTTFAQVRTRDGRIAFANTDAVRVPGALADAVVAVIGLQDVHVAHASAGSEATAGAGTHAATPHDPMDFQAIYGGAGLAAASHIEVAIVSSGSDGSTGAMKKVLADLDAFAAGAGLAPIATSVVNTAGVDTTPGVDAVSDVLSQGIVAMAGGQVKRLVFYNTPTTTNAALTAVFNRIVSDNTAKVVAVPFFECETDAQADGSAAADDAIFALAVAQGQTFVAGTGDSGGADQCGVPGNIPSWPAASPYVVAVSGTRLDASATQWLGESVWPQSGGSPSTFEPMPSWQAGFGIPGTKRATADFAFDGSQQSGMTTLVNGAARVEGGGTLPVALFAGAWARVLEKKGPGFGFAAPLLYALPAADFHDITRGTNDGGTGGAGFAAGAGYDYPSGRGSPILDRVVADSNLPPRVDFHTTLSGSTVQFTDASSDPDGTIVSHAWQFGDGATSTDTNPSHTYASDATYMVTESARDDAGSSRSMRHAVYVGPVQLLANPGFETGTPAFWTVQGTGFLVDTSPSVAFAGCCSALLTNQPAATVLSQRVTIPATGPATLSFHLWVDDESAPAEVIDQIQVQVRSTGGAVLATLATFSNVDGAVSCCTPNYVLHSYDLRSFAGQTVDVAFVLPGESVRLGTAFLLDDVGLFVH